MYKLLLICFIMLFFVGCKENSTDLCNDSSGLYTISEFPIGTAINFFALNNDQLYYEIAVKQFNSITAENIFKPAYLHPEENIFYWADADNLVKFCEENHKRLHGHTLIWHKQLPQWIDDFHGSSSDWDKLMKIHIRTIVSHFKGKISGWDVVNEALDDGGNIRNNIWYQNIGYNYIEKAFKYAHEADPDALLFYNDYDLETNSNKRKSAIRLLNQLRARGVKIDGIGMQLHINLRIDPMQIADALRDISENDYKIHLSELDISVNPDSKNIYPSTELFRRQAELLGKIVMHYKQLQPKYQYGITFWGISDKNSWIRDFYNRMDYPLLYDDNYKPKPVYCTLKEVL